MRLQQYDYLRKTWKMITATDKPTGQEKSHKALPLGDKLQPVNGY